MKFRVGIFQIKNKPEGRIFLQTSTDLDRAFNSDIFQLKAGMHSNSALQNDWINLGQEAFECKIFDEIKVDGAATPEAANQDLKELLAMHISDL